MKRFIVGFFTFALGSLLLSASSFAGLDVRQYHTDFLKQKGMGKASAPAEEKGFEHKSKYEREQQEGTPAPQAAPEKEQKTQKPAGKYDRRYWNPSGFQE